MELAGEVRKRKKINFSAVTQNLSIVLNKYKTITGLLVA